LCQPNNNDLDKYQHNYGAALHDEHDHYRKPSSLRYLPVDLERLRLGAYTLFLHLWMWL